MLRTRFLRLRFVGPWPEGHVLVGQQVADVGPGSVTQARSVSAPGRLQREHLLEVAAGRADEEHSHIVGTVLGRAPLR